MKTLPQRPGLRSALLFLNFFLIMLAYYQVKPASRSLFLGHVGADLLPWLWTASGLLLLVLLPGYQRLLTRFGRLRVVHGTGVAVIGLLLLFRLLLADPGPWSAAGFYLLVDIFSVVLVEQFWSLTNGGFSRREGRRWYGLIASGGLAGGLVGGLAAGAIVRLPGVASEDLILVAAALLALLLPLTQWLAARGVYHGLKRRSASQVLRTTELWGTLRRSRYLALITGLVLFAQICEPLVEYQFMQVVERVYTDGEARTSFLSGFLALMSGVAMGVNLLLTPLLLRRAGIVAGLAVQPLLLGLSALVFALQLDLRSAALMKLADRGLAYSVNRASRELLYVNADARTIFRVKAWIDMVGYRTFKIVGNVAILLLTLLPWQLGSPVLAALVMGLCVLWLGCVFALKRYIAAEDAPARSGEATA